MQSHAHRDQRLHEAPLGHEEQTSSSLPRSGPRISAPGESLTRRRPALSPVQARALREIVGLIRRDSLAVGTHLGVLPLSRRLEMSRSPVAAALAWLARRGVVEHDAHRGYFLRVPPGELSELMEQSAAAAEDPLYLRIAAQRLHGVLPATTSEADLMRRFKTTRSALRRALSRIQQEGWAERAPGQGWYFLPMIDSREAYEESYAFRHAIEPMGLLSPGFRADAAALEARRSEQEAIVSGGWRTMTAVELFEANSRFHETLAACSGNRFLLQSVRRLDQLRRLVEYRQANERAPRKTNAQEHLRMLECIGRGDMLGAAALMRAHLDRARREKAHAVAFTPRARTTGRRPV
jgi:DNA-binding GntR family transcriptional regulator